MRSNFRRLVATIRKKVDSLLTRRPHRSFQMTRRRDYVRSLELPGYISFTHQVNKTFWLYRKLFVILAVIYSVLTVALIGLGSQESYGALLDTLRNTSADLFDGDWGQLGEAGLLFASVATSGLTGTLTEVQQVYSGLLLLLVWLSTVWLLRNTLAGHAVTVRDALYNAGAPILSTFLVALALIIQLLPLGIAIIGYSAASSSGLLDEGIEAMLFWIAASLLALLSLYWVVSSFFAMIIVTLPGMYPLRALTTAGDMVIGRRIRIVLRIVWMTVVIALVWALVLIPFILFDGWIKSVAPAIDGVPIIPVIVLILSTLSIIWSAGYVYLLYRKVVEDDALPA